MTLVKDILTAKVQYVEPDANVLHIAMLMKENECGFIPVAENDKLTGVVTDRDIVLRCIAEDKTPVMTQAKDIMTPKVLYCYDDHSVEDVVMNMAKNQVRRMPVVNQDKRLVGVVSLGDLAQAGDNKEACGIAMGRIAA